MIIEVDTSQKQDIQLGAVGIDDLRQCLHTLMSTIKGSVFLDRELGVDASVIDMPINNLGRIFSTINDAIERYEPRVEVLEIKPYRRDMNGQVEIKVKFKVLEGVE